MGRAREVQTSDQFYPSSNSLQTGFPYSVEYDITFSGLNYKVKVEANDFSLALSVLNVDAPIRLWRSDFKSAYLEDICRKTGFAMTYLEFNLMLQNAFSSASDN